MHSDHYRPRALICIRAVHRNLSAHTCHLDCRIAMTHPPTSSSGTAPMRLTLNTPADYPCRCMRSQFQSTAALGTHLAALSTGTMHTRCNWQWAYSSNLLLWSKNLRYTDLHRHKRKAAEAGAHSHFEGHMNLPYTGLSRHRPAVSVACTCSQSLGHTCQAYTHYCRYMCD